MDYLDRYIYKEISIYDLNYEVLLLDIKVNLMIVSDISLK